MAPRHSIPSDDGHWLIIDGRRWRRTDPSLPDDLVERLTSHLGRGRSGVRAAKQSDDPDAIAASRNRVDLAKTGLGERGPRWWDRPEAERLAQAERALQQLDQLGG